MKLNTWIYAALISMIAIQSLRLAMHQQEIEQLNQEHQATLANIRVQQTQQALQHSQSIRQTEQKIQLAHANIDQTHYKELEHAKNEIQRLRHQLHTGTVRLQQSHTAVCPHPTTATDSRVDTNGQTQPSRHTNQLAEDVLQLAEHASTAIKQRDACVELLTTERQLLTENQPKQNQKGQSNGQNNE